MTLSIMLNKLFSVIKILLPIVLAVVLIYFAFKNVDFNEFWDNLGKVNFNWVIVSLIISVIPYIARAYRWNILISALGYQPKLYPTTLAIVIGYFANLAIPRLGEVIRCGFLQRTSKVPFTISVGTVITERLVDMITLLLLLVIALILEYDVLSSFLSPYLANADFVGIYWALGLLSIAGVTGIVALWMLMRQGKFPKLRNLVQELVKGIFAIAKIKNLPGFLISTVVMWTVYFLMSYVIIFSLESTSHLDLQAGLLLLVTGGIAIAIPVQSGFGTYHTLISALLLIYGIPEVTGLFMATLLHTSQIMAIAILGSLALLLGLLLRSKNETNTVENSDAPRSEIADQ